jgi:hypothetical protein
VTRNTVTTESSWGALRHGRAGRPNAGDLRSRPLAANDPAYMNRPLKDVATMTATSQSQVPQIISGLPGGRSDCAGAAFPN